MLRLGAWAAAMLAAALTSGGAAVIPEDVKEAARIRVDQGHTPGIVIALIQGGSVDYFAYGQTAAGGEPVSEHTVFEIGSITKVFTGVLLADLARAGVVALDDPVAKYLPDGISVPEQDGEVITLERLAAQTSGLPRLPANFQPADPYNPYADFSVDQLHQALSNARLVTVPGEKYAYSNLGMGLLGHVLALAADSDFETIVRYRIGDVIGMPDTAIGMNESMRARLAIGHAGGEPVANWDIPTLAGAGALRSTAADMVRFIQANLGVIETPLYGALAASHEPRADTDIPNTRIGLGWHITSTPEGHAIVWHNGGTGGYRSIAGFVKETGMGVVVLANSSTEVADDIGYHLADPSQPLRVFEARPDVDVPESVLQAYTGRYQIQPGAVFDVELREGRLHVRLTGQDFFPIFPETETNFFYKIVEATITFERGDDGAPTGLVLHQGGVTINASRID